MADLVRFHDLWNRVRADDAQAATDLVRQFEPLVRHDVRPRMTDPRLVRAFDSADVCQSALASFWGVSRIRYGVPQSLEQERTLRPLGAPWSDGAESPRSCYNDESRVLEPACFSAKPLGYKRGIP